MTPRDIEKLKAIGYKVGGYVGIFQPEGPAVSLHRDPYYIGQNADKAWEACKGRCQSPEGMKATMADKVQWLMAHGYEVVFADGICSARKTESNSWIRSPDVLPSLPPETTADIVFWKVP